MTTKFGDGIDWDAEARRAAAASEQEHANGGVRANALELTARLAQYGARGRLLDCGCNIARYYPPLREAGFEYTGVDQSQQALEIAHQRYPNIALVWSMLWSMSFESQFDVAISMAVLQHNTHDEKNRIIHQIAKAVRTGGWFAMQESTVLNDTATQLTHQHWINTVEKHDFSLIDTWHPNPEYAVNDAYLFVRR